MKTATADQLLSQLAKARAGALRARASMRRTATEYARLLAAVDEVIRALPHEWERYNGGVTIHATPVRALVELRRGGATKK